MLGTQLLQLPAHPADVTAELLLQLHLPLLLLLLSEPLHLGSQEGCLGTRPHHLLLGLGQFLLCPPVERRVRLQR